MWVIAVLMFFSLLVAGGFLFAFIWAVRNGQYDDKYTPSVRMLFDDAPREEEKTEFEQENKLTSKIRSENGVK